MFFIFNKHVLFGISLSPQLHSELEAIRKLEAQLGKPNRGTFPYMCVRACGLQLLICYPHGLCLC